MTVLLDDQAIVWHCQILSQIDYPNSNALSFQLGALLVVCAARFAFMGAVLRFLSYRPNVRGMTFVMASAKICSSWICGMSSLRPS